MTEAPLDEESARVVAALQLAPHPEGGYYRELVRGPEVKTPRGPRASFTSIYFLLPPGSFSALHRVRHTEVWHFHAGDPLDLHLIDEVGYRVVRLGTDLESDMQPQVIVPPMCWQAAVPVGPRFTLTGCTVSPGFDFADFEMPSREAALVQLPEYRAVVAQLTR